MNALLTTPTKRSLAKSPGTGIATSILIGLTSIIPLPALAQSNSKQVWSCQAESATRRYIVDQLDRNSNEFDMAIYVKDKGDDRDYIGTVLITVDRTSLDYSGRGDTHNSQIDVSAFGRMNTFFVSDSETGVAVGQCDVNWTMVDRQTRRLIRQCFASARQQSGGPMSRVIEYACINDPVRVMKSPLGD